MNNKYILAAIAAPLLFGGMQTSASASACTAYAPGNVVCDAIDSDTIQNTLDAMMPYATAAKVISRWSSAYEGMQANFNAWPSPYTGQITYNTGSDGIYVVPGTTIAQISYTIRYLMEVVDRKIVSAVGELVAIQAYYYLPGQSTPVADFRFLNINVPLSVPVTAVPGPEAGAGVGALAMLGVAYWAKRRRDEQALAA